MNIRHIYETIHFQQIGRSVSVRLMLLWMLCHPAVPQESNVAEQSQAVEVQMRNVMYHFNDRISVHIRILHGHLLPIKGGPPIFDDNESFKLQVGSAEIAITQESLANVLNSYVFGKKDAPLKE